MEKKQKAPSYRYSRQSAEKAASATCDQKSRCGLCLYVNQPYESALEKKHAFDVAFLKENIDLSACKVLAPQGSPKQTEYRASAKLAVRLAPKGSEKRFAIGLFKPKSHQVIDAISCPLHTLPIRSVLEDLSSALEASSLHPYDEVSNTGDVRYVTIRSSHKTGELMLVFVVTKELAKAECKRIVTQLRGKNHTIGCAFININNESGNAIYGSQTISLTGSQHYLRETLAHLNFQVAPTSFFQVNPWQADLLYRRLEQHIGYNAQGVAFDLYCGIGPIAMLLARAGYRVLGIEENPEAIELAKTNMQQNQLLPDQQPSEMIAGRVEDCLAVRPAWATHPSMIVVNPSRRGLAEPVRQFLIEQKALGSTKQLMYVSCDVQSFARDLKDLTVGGWKIRQMESFDMFSQTDKLEWLAILS